jgi:hypothetical protein
VVTQGPGENLRRPACGKEPLLIGVSGNAPAWLQQSYICSSHTRFSPSGGVGNGRSLNSRTALFARRRVTRGGHPEGVWSDFGSEPPCGISNGSLLGAPNRTHAGPISLSGHSRLIAAHAVVSDQMFPEPALPPRDRSDLMGQQSQAEENQRGECAEHDGDSPDGITFRPVPSYQHGPVR